jgi:hypothetical protein
MILYIGSRGSGTRMLCRFNVRPGRYTGACQNRSASSLQPM